MMTETLLLWINEVDNLISSPEDVRNESYNTIIKNGSKDRQANIVYEYLITHNNSSNADIEEGLKMRISSVTARINELRKKGLIEIAGSKINKKTGKLNIVWKV